MGYSTNPRHYINFLLSRLFPKLDEIKFQIIEGEDADEIYPVPFAHTDIIVNGKSLFRRLEDFELSEARRTKTSTALAGKYVGIGPENLFTILKSGSSKKFAIWQCSICRSSLCAADLVCDFKATPFYFELSNFRQTTNPKPLNNQQQHEETIFKTKWNYMSFGPFRFGRSEVFNELKKAMGL